MRDFIRPGIVLLGALCLLLVGVTVSAAAPSAEAPFFQGQVVVKADPDALRAEGYNIVKVLPNAGLVVVQVPVGMEKDQAQALRARGKKAAQNRVAHKFVNDPYASYQWHFPNVQAEQAWGMTTGTGAVVAVLDSGLATGGEDGIGCVKPGYDIVNGDSSPVDGDGHGTHVSGTIAQKTNNNIGVAGLAYGACVMPVKVLDDTGSGSFADIADGIYWAVDHGADVINMSLGIDAAYQVTNDPVVDPALNYAYAHNVTVVVASGNDGNRRNVSYPAIYPTCIAVGATDFNNSVPRYSNKGTGLDIVAPGGDTTKDENGDGYPDGVLQETRLSGSWGYYFFDGTSMASPHVAAVAALLYAQGVATNPDDVYAALTETALDFDGGGWTSASGYGLVQAYAALNWTGGGTCTDNDGDGYCVTDGDCDDNNPNVNPGMPEICGDGIDNNCAGGIDEGCGGGDCLPIGSPCSSNDECCNGRCHAKKHTCN